MRPQTVVHVGVYTVPTNTNDERHKHFCVANGNHRINKVLVPCKEGHRSNVNTHHKNGIVLF